MNGYVVMNTLFYYMMRKYPEIAHIELSRDTIFYGPWSEEKEFARITDRLKNEPSLDYEEAKEEVGEYFSGLTSNGRIMYYLGERKKV